VGRRCRWNRYWLAPSTEAAQPAAAERGDEPRMVSAGTSARLGQLLRLAAPVGNGRGVARRCGNAWPSCSSGKLYRQMYARTGPRHRTARGRIGPRSGRGFLGRGRSARSSRGAAMPGSGCGPIRDLANGRRRLPEASVRDCRSPSTAFTRQ
jgi:hypothetical protein